MTDLPDPPNWPRTSVTLDEDLKDDMESIRTTAFFDGRAEAETEAKENFEIIGKGTGRIAITGPRFPDGTIAKVAISQRGYQANQAEDFERDQRPEIAPYLPPVLARHSQSNWAVFERCQVPPANESETINQLENVLDHHNVNYEWRELASTNIGTYNGNVCIVDWAELFR